jgi:hypothetical protein
MHMYPTIQETGPVGKVQIGQKAVREVLQPQSHAPVSQQQQQLVQQQQAFQQLQQQNQQQQQLIQQMRQQMLEMQEVIMEYRQPKAKTYTTGQVQILLSAETINHVVEEFELSSQKRDRLLLARDYLLRLSDLSEWIPAATSTTQQLENEPQQQVEGSDDTGEPDAEAIDEGDDQLGRQYGEDELCEEPSIPLPGPGISGGQKSPVAAETGGDVYKGKIDPEIATELEKIEQRMEELKQEPGLKPEKEKHKTGIEKIKDFLTKKPQPEEKPIDYSKLPEGMG